MEEAIPKAQWAAYSEALKNLCLAEHLFADHPCTTDAARVLRVPRTVNWKNPDAPEPVVILPWSWGNGPYPLTRFDILRNVAPKINGPAKANGASHPQGNGHAADLSAFEIPYSGLIINAHMRHFSETGCQQEGEEPLWKACAGVLARCQDEDRWMHEWSRKDPRYYEAETQKKLDERRKNHTGASLCSQFHDIGTECAKVCEACPHWGTIKSPISLGFKIDELPSIEPDGQTRAMP